MRLGFLCAAVAASCFIVSTHCALAQSADTPLRLQEAVRRTLERNLDLKAFEYELAAQSGRLQQARARPNPEVGVLVEDAFGSGERSRLDTAQTTLSLGFCSSTALVNGGSTSRWRAAACWTQRARFAAWILLLKPLGALWRCS